MTDKPEDFKEKMLRLARGVMTVKEHSDYGRDPQASMAIDALYTEAKAALMEYEEGYATYWREEDDD